MTGTEDDDVFLAGGGNAQMTGHGGDDTLYGEAGADVLNGRLGNDVLDGGGDNGVATDTAFYYDGPSLSGLGVRVSLQLQGAPQDTHTQGFDTLIDIESLYGT